MMEHTDGEVWEREYKDVFFGDPKVAEAKAAAPTKLAPAVEGQPGSLNIQPRSKPATPVTDLSQFFGRAGNAGKRDPGKAVVQAKARARRKVEIGTDDSGNLTVEGAEGPPEG